MFKYKMETYSIFVHIYRTNISLIWCIFRTCIQNDKRMPLYTKRFCKDYRSKLRLKNLNLGTAIDIHSRMCIYIYIYISIHRKRQVGTASIFIYFYRYTRYLSNISIEI